MGTTKTALFTERHNRLAMLAKALAHPARIAIMEVLMKRDGCVCGDIVDELPLSQATVSQHLKALKEAGLIKGEINGKFTCYCVDAEACRETQASLEKLFAGLKDCC